jgi:hypothetical protein
MIPQDNQGELMTSTAPNKVADDLVSELTDKAIEAEIRKLDRMIQSRNEDIAEIREEVGQFMRRRALLIEQKIERLQSQLEQEQA